MKNLLLVFAAALMLGSCAGPKSYYNFSYHDYNSGKKAMPAATIVVADNNDAIEPLSIAPQPVAESPLIISSEPVASSAKTIEAPESPATLLDGQAFERKYADMSRSERREFRKALKDEVKELVKHKKNTDNGATISEAKAMDHDLKMALIFGAVALTLSFFGGVNSIFWILSVVSLVVAVVFFIKWIAEQ